MNDVLNDDGAARLAIPDIGYDGLCPAHKLKALGLAVQAHHPELAGWPPYLAGEAHLYYAAHFPVDSSNVQARSLEFLAFLRAAIAGPIKEFKKP